MLTSQEGDHHDGRRDGVSGKASGWIDGSRYEGTRRDKRHVHSVKRCKKSGGI